MYIFGLFAIFNLIDISINNPSMPIDIFPKD